MEWLESTTVIQRPYSKKKPFTIGDARSQEIGAFSSVGKSGSLIRKGS